MLATRVWLEVRVLARSQQTKGISYIVSEMVRVSNKGSCVVANPSVLHSHCCTKPVRVICSR